MCLKRYIHVHLWFYFVCRKIVYFGGIYEFGHSWSVQDLLSGIIKVSIPFEWIDIFCIERLKQTQHLRLGSLNISWVDAPIFALLFALSNSPSMHMILPKLRSQTEGLLSISNIISTSSVLYSSNNGHPSKTCSMIESPAHLAFHFKVALSISLFVGKWSAYDSC